MSAITITTRFSTTDALADDVLGGMIEAQNTFGQITWTDLRTDQARGKFTNADGDQVRMVIGNLDDLTARDAFDIASWVNGMIA